MANGGRVRRGGGGGARRRSEEAAVWGGGASCWRRLEQLYAWHAHATVQRAPVAAAAAVLLLLCCCCCAAAVLLLLCCCCCAAAAAAGEGRVPHALDQIELDVLQVDLDKDANGEQLREGRRELEGARRGWGRRGGGACGRGTR